MACFCSCIWGNPDPGPVRLREVQQVVIDTSKMGVDCVVVKSGRRVCGTGAALANAPIVQDKSYFEVKIQCGGVWGVGLATPTVSLDTVPLGTDTNSWVLTSEGTTVHNSQTISRGKQKPNEGDIIGISYDHVEMNFFLNGKSMDLPVTGIRGTVFPAIYVDDGAILDVQFMDFTYPPPDGYDQILLERNLL
ncbi:PREDICTED: SPRY domain-containing protein 7-like [Amphimedon queenslandica]|uniref:SPRY domain-containing protein 7 n=1 Tax=Amphimedon queenslandica TaxID=400682 RepID=A0A1X7TX56_AMPQE|nr:PREDICTED: SPRY domain-containing protein 7-like [Amphimedon queenslandica]|eukprot:XP_003389614.1 PREDICTED: SPRY domain-containing protein 7-like [Amphimedon queenslandica]